MTDKSGGAIVGAAISVKNSATGFVLTQNTSSNGFYRLPLLPPGAYALTVETPKFSRYLREPIQVFVSQTSRVDVLLQLSTIAEPVTITADASPIDTSTNTLGKTVSGREVLDLRQGQSRAGRPVLIHALSVWRAVSAGLRCSP